MTGFIFNFESKRAHASQPARWRARSWRSAAASNVAAANSRTGSCTATPSSSDLLSDLQQFESACLSGERARARALYCGEPLPGFFDDWAQHAACRLGNDPCICRQPQRWVVGTAYNTLTTANHAYMLPISAVPAAATEAMLLAGLAAMGLMTRRRQNRT